MTKNRLALFLGALAAVGWLFAIFILNDRDGMRRDMERQTAAVGTISELEERIAALESEAGSFEAARAEQEEARNAAEAELTELQSQIAAGQEELATAESEFAGLQEQLDPLRSEIATFDDRLAETEQTLQANTEELTAVGERLTEGREQEAELQERLAGLTEETATLTAESAEAETRIQEAREAEASLETEVATAAESLETIRAEEATLREQVTQLTETRDRLTQENEAATAQQQSLQGMVTQLSDDLATRAAQLAEQEQRFATLQEQSIGSGAVAELAEIEPGTLPAGNYTMGPVNMSLTDDGSFTMQSEAPMGEVTGSYAVEEGNITFSEAEGDIGDAAFPLTCAISSGEGGIFLEDNDGSCALLDGQSVVPN